MDKELRFLRNISSDKNTHSSRARRRKMQREIQKLQEWKKNENKSGDTDSTDKSMWRRVSLTPPRGINTHGSYTKHHDMNEHEVIEWIETYLDGTNYELTAKGMILNDINEYSFDTWINMPALNVVDGYLEATQEVATALVQDYKNMLSQESELDELGVTQTMRIDPVQSMEAFSEGMMDVFKSLSKYLEVKDMAEGMYYEQ